MPHPRPRVSSHSRAAGDGSSSPARRRADEEGNVVGKGDMRAQIEQVGKNVQVCLKPPGRAASDIVMTRAYVTDADAFKKNADVFARVSWPGAGPYPVPVAFGRSGFPRPD